MARSGLLRFVDRSTNLSNFDSVDADVSVETNVDIVGSVIKATIVKCFIFKATIVKSVIFKANVVKSVIVTRVVLGLAGLPDFACQDNLNEIFSSCSNILLLN